MKTIKTTNKGAITISNALNLYKAYLQNSLDTENTDVISLEVYMVEDLIAELKTKL